LKAAFTKVKLRSKSLKLSSELNTAEEISIIDLSKSKNKKEHSDSVKPASLKQDASNKVVKEKTSSVDTKPAKPIVRLRSIKNRKNSRIASGESASEPEWIARAKRLSQNFSAKVAENEIKEAEETQKVEERNIEPIQSEQNKKTKRLSVPVVKLTEVINLDADEIVLQTNEQQKVKRRSTTHSRRRRSVKFEEKPSGVPVWMEMALKIQSDRKNAKVV